MINERKQFLEDYKKDKSCEKCNWNKHTKILQFHHKNNKKKKFGIASSKSIFFIKQEIEKVIMEFNKEIEIDEKLLDEGKLTRKGVFKRVSDRDELRAKLQGFNEAIKLCTDEIDDLDIVQLCTQLKDEETGKIIELPEEIEKLLFKYCDYIKNYLKERFGSSNIKNKKEVGIPPKP